MAIVSKTYKWEGVDKSRVTGEVGAGSITFGPVLLDGGPFDVTIVAEYDSANTPVTEVDGFMLRQGWTPA
jgi:hypothetical protein